MKSTKTRCAFSSCILLLLLLLLSLLILLLLIIFFFFGGGGGGGRSPPPALPESVTGMGCSMTGASLLCLLEFVLVCVCGQPCVQGLCSSAAFHCRGAGALGTPWQTQCNEAMPWSGKQFRTLNCVPAGHPKKYPQSRCHFEYRFPLVCVSWAIPLGANYVGGCSHKSDFAFDLTEAFDFLDSQATGGVFHLRHESSCLMSGPERSFLRMIFQFIQLLIRSVCLHTVHVTSNNQLHDCLTSPWIPRGPPKDSSQVEAL